MPYYQVIRNASVVKPVMSIIGKAKGTTRIAASNLMLTDNGVPVFVRYLHQH